MLRPKWIIQDGFISVSWTSFQLLKHNPFPNKIMYVWVSEGSMWTYVSVGHHAVTIHRPRKSSGCVSPQVCVHAVGGHGRFQAVVFWFWATGSSVFYPRETVVHICFSFLSSLCLLLCPPIELTPILFHRPGKLYCPEMRPCKCKLFFLNKASCTFCKSNKGCSLVPTVLPVLSSGFDLTL